MPLRRDFLFYVILAASAAAPAIAQTSLSDGVAGITPQTAAVPDFSGTWQHPVFPWFEPPASGAGPITNLSRWAQLPIDGRPPGKEGVSDYDQLVGDYKNPILQPWAAEIVRKSGEMSLAGITFPNPS